MDVTKLGLNDGEPNCVTDQHAERFLEVFIVSDKAPMPFAERVGRLILFPLSWIDEASTKRREKLRKEREEAKAAEQRRIEAERRAEQTRHMEEFNAAKAAEEARIEAEKVEDLARGERARYKCQLLYDRYEYQIREKFPQEKLDRYFDEYMKDEFPAEVIERRSEDLQAMIKSFVEVDQPTQKSPDEITQYFEQQRSHLQTLNLAPDVLEAQILELNYRQDQAMKEHFRNL